MPEPNHQPGLMMYPIGSKKITLNFIAVLVALFMLTGLLQATHVHAQQANNGSICVLAFDDANRNATRDPGEAAISDVAVNLIVNDNVIVANHVTDGKEPFCFPNLAAQQYTVTFS